MSRSQTHPDSLYGIREFDLSVPRDDELLQLPSATYLATLDAPAEAYLRLGSETAKRIDLRELDSIKLDSPIGQAYLSNPGNTGTLRLLAGKAGNVEITPEQTIDAIEDITGTVTTDPTDRAAREIGKIRAQDSGGVLIDPATEPTLSAIAGALGSNDTDQLLVQEDTPLDVSAATVGVQEATPLDVSAATVGVQEATPLDVSAANVPTEQQTPVGLEDGGGVQIDPATEPTLSAIAGALGSNATDQLLVQEDTPLDVSGATVGVQEATPLDVSAATVDVQEETPLDVSGATVPTDPNDGDAGSINGAALLANDSVTVASLAAVGTESLHGQAKSTGSYDLAVEWLDAAGGVIRSETLASPVAGGTWTDINVDARSPYADVIITDTSGADQTADGSAQMG